MPGRVTPARRQRSQTVEDEDYVSLDRSESTRSSASKRARLDVQDVQEPSDVFESQSEPLLPDSYRRSPNMQRCAPGGTATARSIEKHQPGAIVRVTLTNFVTYTNVEFQLGPRLNMIIGPNGTGKSTLVCAICLGLGWATSHLGRAKDIGEFVKHGCKQAEIRIELAADPARQADNPIITTRIFKEGNKSEYFIDDKKANRKQVQSFARSFSIQVDNLCQFLPQDRVVEFAALSPVDLLTHTQLAAAPDYMSEWHEDLKTMSKEQKRRQGELQNLTESLKNLENRQRLQEADVIRLRERAQMQTRAAALEKMRPFPEYGEAKAAHREVKDREKETARELRRLRRKLEPNLRSLEEKKAYVNDVEKVVQERETFIRRGETKVVELRKKLNSMQEQILQCGRDIDNEKTAVRDQRAVIPRCQSQIRGYEIQMQQPPPEYDMSEMAREIRQKTIQIREVNAKIEENKTTLTTLSEQVKQRQTIVQLKEKEKEDLRSQAGQQANKLKRASPDAGKAWDWIQKNRDSFKGPVYGPPMVECSVKDQNHAKAVEALIPFSEMTSFTVTTSEDFKKLQDQLYGALKLSQINIRNSTQPLASFTPSVPVEHLTRLGLQSYILDLIDGPDAVLAMLCENRNLHQAAFTSQDITEEQFEAIKCTNITSWVTVSQSYQITRRREYGDHATSIRVKPLDPARFFTDTPVDGQLEQELDAAIREAKGEMQLIVQEAKEIREKGKADEDRHRELSEEKNALDEAKAAKQRATAEYDALPTKRDKAQSLLDDALAKVAASRERRREVEERQDGLCLQKAQLALDLAGAIGSLRELHIELLECEILRIHAKSDVQQLSALHENEQRMLNDKETEIVALQNRKAELHARAVALSERCQRIAGGFTTEEAEIYQQEVVNWTSDQLETEIQSTQARLEMTLGGGNENTLREFERRGRSIEEKRAALSQVEEQLASLETEIAAVRRRWEPELDEIVAKISDAFAENFAGIECAGEVTVHKDEDFEHWAIQIKVKFRQTEALSILDSHRQSGGERAVSTIFYLMALQSLARAPFRVVDEINQGMDPRNERMVHSRMVDIACAEHTSQYFLITPKLLQGLKYHPDMRVHCIASGEYMPSDHRTLDFGMLARKALALRAGGC